MLFMKNILNYKAKHSKQNQSAFESEFCMEVAWLFISLYQNILILFILTGFSENIGILWDGLPLAGGCGQQVAVIPAPRCFKISRVGVNQLF